MALDAAGRPGGLDLAMVERTRQLLVRASVLPTSSEVLEDPKAIDTYKHYQGELTGALFQLVGTAQSWPGFAGDAALLALRAELPRDEQALAEARGRYRKAAASYNAGGGVSGRAGGGPQRVPGLAGRAMTVLLTAEKKNEHTR